MNTELKNIFQSIPENLDEEIFDLLIQNKNIKVERIISKGQTSPKSGWYNQEQDEWVIVLKGEAIISFRDGEDISLKVGSHINIPAHTQHKVKWTNPDRETIWLAIHYRAYQHITSPLNTHTACAGLLLTQQPFMEGVIGLRLC